ncbi:MAG: delta-60 repeat domain-containing protein, partial [Solirubrobacterales bacterium]
MALSPAAAVAAPGDLDTTFNPNANQSVWSVVVQGDGKILIGGDFTTVGGETRNRVARLNADGTLDTTFANPNANNNVRSVGVQGDGKILIAGFFTTVGGQARNGVARLNADGTLDATFATPNADSSVYSFGVQGDGKILIGGQFTTVGGQARNFVARLSGTSSGPASSPSNSVTPTGGPTPTPEPTPGPTPTVSVSALKAKVSKKGAYLTSRVTVSGAGRIAQAATTSRRVGKGSKRRTKVTTRCRVSKTVSAAGTY